MSRFPRPEVVRISLADLARKAHADLMARKKPEATPAEIERSALRVAEAKALNDWIEVKKRLSSGEERDAFARCYLPTVDGSTRIDRMRLTVVRIAAYLVNWSLKDDDGKIVPIAGRPHSDVMSTLDALDPESFAEIRAAIDAHEAHQESEREQEKKARFGSPTAAPTSPSPSELVGASSG